MVAWVVSARPYGFSARDRRRDRVDLDHGVVLAVDVQVELGDQEVLVERRIRPRVDHRAVGRGVAVVLQRRGDHQAGRADLALDVAVLVEPPVDQVLVVRHRRVHRDDHPTHPAHLRPGVGVHVLPQHGVVLLVQTDRLRDELWLTLAVRDDGVDVDDLAETVAAQLERGGHVAQTPLADVVRGPPVVVEARIAVRHHHLGEGHPVGDVSFGTARIGRVGIVEGDLVDHRALAEVEAEPHRPVLPAQLVAVEGERDTVGLGDLERLQVGPRRDRR